MWIYHQDKCVAVLLYTCTCANAQLTMHLMSTTSHSVTHMTVESFCAIHIMLYWTQDLTLFLGISLLIVVEVCRITNCILATEISLKIPRMVYLIQNVASWFYLDGLRDSQGSWLETVGTSMVQDLEELRGRALSCITYQLCFGSSIIQSVHLPGDI